MAKTCPVCNGSYADTISFCPNDGSTLLADNDSGDLVGRVIADRYKVSELLGEGGMGRVYLARHVRLPQQAAIKVMHATMARDGDAVARFNREAANAARIEHDRVARVFDFGETSDGLVYLAMEYVPGTTLRSLLERETRFAPSRAAAITYQVAEGLDAAHRLSIVHRDLKPDNILVITDEQGVDRCKVVDFGIAKAGDNKGTQLTRTGMIVGTPEFMSPEQVVGEAVDARSDVYALALVAFQMFTGELPFSGNTPERALMTRLMEDPRTLAQVAPDVAWPDALQEAFTRALDREVESRTPSALAFADAVLAATEHWLGTPVMRGRTPASLSAVIPGVTPTGMSVVGDAGRATSSTASSPRPTPSTTRAEAAKPATVASSTSTTSAAPSAGTSTPAASGGGRMPILAGAVVVVALVGGWFAYSRMGGAPSPVGTDSAATAAPVASGTPGGVAPAATSNPSATSTPGTVASDPAAGGTSGAVPPVVPPSPRPPTGTPAAGTGTVTPPSAVAPAVAGAGAPPAGASLATASALAARRSLDSIRNILEDANSGEPEARAAIPALQRVLRDLGSGADSAWAYLALVSAYGQSGDPHRACTPLRSAKRLAATDAQRQAVTTFFNSDALACVP